MRQYNFNRKTYFEITEKRLNVINIAFQKCGSYCRFGNVLGVAPQNARELINGNRKYITKNKWEKIRLIAANGDVF